MSGFQIAAIILACAAFTFSIVMLVRVVKVTKELGARETQQRKDDAPDGKTAEKNDGAQS